VDKFIILHSFHFAHPGGREVGGVGAGPSGVRIPLETSAISLPQNVQTGSGTQKTLILSGHWKSFPGLRRPGREVKQSPPSSTEAKNEWGCVFLAYSVNTAPYICTSNNM